MKYAVGVTSFRSSSYMSCRNAHRRILLDEIIWRFIYDMLVGFCQFFPYHDDISQTRVSVVAIPQEFLSISGISL